MVAIATQTPTSTAASNLGTLYYSQGRYADAARALEKAVTIPPESFRVWANLGAALYWTPGEREKAKGAYLRAVELAEEARGLNPRRVDVLRLQNAAWNAMKSLMFHFPSPL